ncbi:hypothetical protein IWQ61_005531 [Dispira simplex]|nr:hypothetical protein IWQ61_005531 [Dispira simplex]
MGLRSHLPIALLVTLAAQGLAKVSITSPTKNVKWEPGNYETITWIVDTDRNKKGAIEVRLYRGSDLSKTKDYDILKIPENTDRTNGTVTVRAPNGLDKALKYAIAIVDKDGAESFSHEFNASGVGISPKESPSKGKKEDQYSESEKPTKTSSTNSKETGTVTQSSQYSRKTTDTETDSIPTRTRTISSTAHTTTRSTMRPTLTIEPEEQETNEDDSAAVHMASLGYSVAVIGLVSFWCQW